MGSHRRSLLGATALSAIGRAAPQACLRARRNPAAGLPLLAAPVLGLTAALLAGPVAANPEGGVVVGGQVAISTPDSRTLRIDQGSQNAIVNWKRFDIAPGEAVEIHQPSAASAILNRVTGSTEASRLLGRLTANGQVMLVNPNGVMIGRDAVIDVAALVATTADIPNADFMAGGRAFSIPGNPDAAVTNAGTINVREGGLVALVAPGVENSGVITARLGRVAMASGDTVTLDFYGDGLLEVAADSSLLREVVDADGNPLDVAVSNRGTIRADGGQVWLTAASGARILETAVNVQGLVQADTVAEQDGEIVLTAGDAGGVEIIGTVNARGTATGGDGGRVQMAGRRIIQRGPVDVSGTGEGSGGSVSFDAAGMVAVGNRVSAGGGQGGEIRVAARTLSSAGRLDATGATGAGGTIDIAAGGSVIETASALVDASGATDGGGIRMAAARQVTTSGTLLAEGGSGRGGRIDMTAPAVKLLSPRLSVAGAAGGGRLRIGGEFQGGKHLEVDELANASTVVATDATRLSAAATGADGDGGTAIIWSDQETVFLGEIDVRPGSAGGDGGLAEISSAGLLTWRGQVATGRGDRAGQVLLDPKNITIAAPTYSQYSLILGYNYTDLLPQEEVGTGDQFGTSVSLSGQRLVAGAPGDDGVDDTTTDAGAAYMFYFADTAFNGGILQGVIGKGYTGGNNVDVSQLEAGDEFGSAVSLDGTTLLVGAPNDDGASGSAADNYGAVYSFSFTTASLTAGSLVGRLGHGYSGTNDLNLSAILDTGDYFGQGAALSGTSFAVGAPGDAGSLDALAGAGAVYTFTSSTGLTSPVQQSVIGHGYSGGKNLDPSIQLGDGFGYSVALDGTRMAAGAIGDDGSGDGITDAGAVYLLTFSDTAFSSPTQGGTVGVGYITGNDVNISLDSNDRLGKAVGLGTQSLYVGAPEDDGSGGSGSSNYGAVYKIDFSDASMNGGTLYGTAGRNYVGATDINISLSSSALFGRAVGVDGSRWAAGEPGNAGDTNPLTNTGAVRLFTGFSSSSLAGTVGRNYAGPKDIDLSRLPAQADAFGSAVALYDQQLAVGAPMDDGAGDPGSTGNAGAVYLFKFSDSSFSGGALKGIMGSGYVGGSNVDVTALSAADNFGAAVSLEGTKLAVGAPGDDGAADSVTNSGAVYLYTFTDANFSGATQAHLLQADSGGTLTAGDSLEANDEFGSAVSLNSDRLAVGTPGDDGNSNVAADVGAVRLYSVPAALTGATLIGKIGAGYSGGSDIDPDGLSAGDSLGSAVALDSTRLAVGAPLAKTATDTGSEVGAVHLFTFSSSALTSGSQVGIIGSGDYSGSGQTVNVALGSGDKFGSGVAIDDKGLAVGAPGDDGASNTVTDAGAAYYFEFADLAFTSPTQKGVFGNGYTGGANLNVGVEAGDLLGAAVSLNADRMAVGASNDDGSGNLATGAGAVYLFAVGNGSASTQLFGNNPSGTVTISSAALADLLATPQTVYLQASNDITLTDAITVNNASGNGGSLYLAAGRSILLNNSITTDNGSFFAKANATAADGVVDAQREAGAAAITMVDGYSINAGTGQVNLEIGTGAGNTNSASGTLTVSTITAGDVYIANTGTTAGSDIANAGSTPKVTANSVVFSASTGKIGDTGMPMNVDAAKLEAAASSSIDLQGYSALQIGGAALGSLDGISAGGTLSLNIAGQISQTEQIVSTGAASFSATGAPIILDHAANDFAGVVSLTTTSGQVTLRDANALSLASSTINGTFTVTAGGAITQSAGLTVNAPSNFTTTAGDITLSNTGNTFGSVMTLTTATGGNATIDAGSAIILGNVDVGGNLQVSGSGPATLTQDVTAVGNAVFPNGITAAGNVDVVSETGYISVNTVSHGTNNLLLAADTMFLDGNWSGTGTRTIKPYSANRDVAIAPATTPTNALEITSAEVARLENDSPSMVTIGRRDGSSTMNTGTWSFNDPLTLLANTINLSSSTLTKSAGALTLGANGAVTGAVNLAAGTGTLSIDAASVSITGTVNGQTGSQAAQHVSYTGSNGSGPFTINGSAFHTVTPSTPAPSPVEEVPDEDDDEVVEAPVDDGGSGAGDGGDGSPGGGSGDAGDGTGGSDIVEDATGGSGSEDGGGSTGETVTDATGAGGTEDDGSGTLADAEKAAAGFDSGEVEAVEASAQVSGTIDEVVAANTVTQDLTDAALDNATGLSGSADAEAGDGGDGEEGADGEGGGRQSALQEQEPFEDGEEAQDEEQAADDEETARQEDEGEPEEDEEEQAPRRQEKGYASNRYVEVVDVEEAAESQDADDGGAALGAGCAC